MNSTTFAKAQAYIKKHVREEAIVLLLQDFDHISRKIPAMHRINLIRMSEDPAEELANRVVLRLSDTKRGIDLYGYLEAAALLRDGWSP